MLCGIIPSISIKMSATACSMKHSAEAVLCGISTMQTEIRRESGIKIIVAQSTITKTLLNRRVCNKYKRPILE